MKCDNPDCAYCDDELTLSILNFLDNMTPEQRAAVNFAILEAAKKNREGIARNVEGNNALLAKLRQRS